MATGIFSLLKPELPLKRYGYQVFRHQQHELFPALKRRFEGFLSEKLAEFSGKPVNGFLAEHYHRWVPELEIDHHQFIQKYRRYLPESWADDPYLAAMRRQVSALIGREVRLYQNRLEFRVCRPKQDDNNPWHRDHWFPYFLPLVNTYLPIAGSYVDSALQVVPYSHEWTDEDVVPTFDYSEMDTKKTERNGVKYSVPEVKSSRHEIRGHRPDVVPGDFMLFSPRAVHGAGSNQSVETRFSFEFRFELVP